MKNAVVHRLVGYDPKSERVVFDREIPERLLAKVLTFVAPDEDDPEFLDAYALDPSAAKNILSILNLEAGRGWEYFIQAFQRSEGLAQARGIHVAQRR